MKYLTLAEIYEELSKTASRLDKTEILSKFLHQLQEQDKDVMYLLLGNIYAEYDERKNGISHQIAIKAISKATGINDKMVVKEWKALGDLGEVAQKLTKSKKQVTLSSSKNLTTQKVIENFRKLPALEGKGTVGKKLSLITELLASASPLESKYLIRTLIGDLRIGIQESTIRESLAQAFFKDEESAAEKIQRAIDKSNDIGEVFELAKEGKLKSIEKVSLEVGKPIKAMLAQKALSIEDGFEKVGTPCAIEYKYDGFRLIIHKKGNNIILFTRRLENVTKQFPEVVEYIQKYVKGDSLILDSEAVGFDGKTKEYKPFQVISQRIRRKYDIKEIQEKLPVEVNVFDILYYQGKSMLDTPFKERTELVRKIIDEHPYKIIHSKQIITSDKKKAEEFYKKALKDHQEGIMLKNLDAIYQPGSRVGHMLKLKPEAKELDLVITGAEYGTGKRSGWLSSFILSCRGKEKGEFLEIGKMGTGIKEKEELGISFQELTDKIKPLITKEEGKLVHIKPKIVVTIIYQEIQHSPTYSSGFALRFPRLTALRPDKPLSEVADLKEVTKDMDAQKRNWKYG